MPVRIYDISKKLGLENKEIISKAKSLGIIAARVASSTLDKITAEYLEGELLKDHPEITAPPPPPPRRPSQSKSSPRRLNRRHPRPPNPRPPNSQPQRQPPSRRHQKSRKHPRRPPSRLSNHHHRHRRARRSGKKSVSFNCRKSRRPNRVIGEAAGGGQRARRNRAKLHSRGGVISAAGAVEPPRTASAAHTAQKLPRLPKAPENPNPPSRRKPHRKLSCPATPRSSRSSRRLSFATSPSNSTPTASGSRQRIRG